MPELALLSLRSREEADEWNEQVFAPLDMPRLETAEAIQRLADLPLHQFGVMRRLIVIHDLARNRDTEPGLLGDEATRNLVASVVGHERTDEAWNLANEMETDLDLADFIRSLQDRRLISQRLKPITSPVCKARQLGDGSVEITASYETPGEVPAFYFGADPMNWPVCNPFFQSMTRRGGLFRLPEADNVNGRGYGSRIEEVVGVPPFFEWRTFLNVRYFVAKTAVGMEFDLTDGGDGAIDVDHGFVVVETRPDKKVRIRSEKTVRFSQLPEGLAVRACAFGWIDMMQGMAICEGDCAADFANLAEVAVRTHTDRIVKACQRAADGNYGAKDLVRDTARFWSQVVSDTASAGFLAGKYLMTYSKDEEKAERPNDEQPRPR